MTRRMKKKDLVRFLKKITDLRVLPYKLKFLAHKKNLKKKRNCIKSENLEIRNISIFLKLNS